MTTILPIDFPIGMNPHFLDSGAFSLFSRNRDNPEFFRSRDFWDYVDDYARFIKKYATAIDYYANVDVIKNPKRTYKIQKYLEKKHGLQPIPVVHYGDDLSWLKLYLEEDHSYIALGGVPAGKLHFKTQKKMRVWYRDWADAAFTMICDTPNHLPKCKVHGFGVTQFRNMRRYPWFSVDSTAWVIKSAYGQIMVPPRELGEFVFDKQYKLFFVGHDSPYVDTAGTGKSKSQVSNLLTHEISVCTPRGRVPSSDAKKHLMNIGKTLGRKWAILDWLKEINVPLGRTKKSGKVIEPGVSNCMIQRTAANIRYYQRLVASLPEWPWPFVPEARRSTLSEAYLK
jgi:hypothetical protein